MDLNEFKEILLAGLRPGVEYGELRDAKEHIVSYWIEYTKKIGSPADRETILEWLFLKCLDAIDDFIELAQTADDEITNFRAPDMG